MSRHPASLRNRFLTTIIVLLATWGLGSLPVNSAQAATGPAVQSSTGTGTAGTSATTTGSAPQLLCPPGTNDPVYCSDYCPGATLVGDVCVSTTQPATNPGSSQVSATTATVSGKTVLPQATPAVFRWRLGRVNLQLWTGSALKVKLQSAARGGAQVKSLRLLLPAGLTFARPSLGIGVSEDVGRLQATPRTLTIPLRAGLPTTAVEIGNRALIESSQLRAELASSQVTTLTFHLQVVTAAGRRSDLTFSVSPRATLPS